VAPIAHYHMGGIVADKRMATAVPGLFAVGGANGANRLSGNAVTEALVFGRRAGRSAAEHARRVVLPAIPRDVTSAAIDLITADAPGVDEFNTAAAIEALQAAMDEDVGPLRDAPRLRRALVTIADLTVALGERPCGKGGAFEMRRLEWLRSKTANQTN
jgi:succinate dehydrogenase / fumarate reductase flavoprotein subunit